MDGRRFDETIARLAERLGSRRGLVRASGALTLGGVLSHLGLSRAYAAKKADATCPVAPPPFSAIGRHRLAQTFRAEHTGDLIRATIQVTSSNNDDFLVEIRKTGPTGFPRKGIPISNVLASVQVNDIADPATNETTPVIAKFNPPAPVKKGKRYALVVTGLNGATPLLQTNLDGCGGSPFEDDELDDSFLKREGFDLVFATVVKTA